MKRNCSRADKDSENFYYANDFTTSSDSETSNSESSEDSIICEENYVQIEGASEFSFSDDTNGQSNIEWFTAPI